MKSISYIDNIETWRAGFTFSIPVKVRFSETDLIGHVNNVSVFIYFEEARVDYLHHLGFHNSFGNKKYSFVVADLQCDYLQQMYFNEKVDVYVKVATLGTTSIDLHYMAINEDNEMTITGRGRLVMVDLEKNRSTPIPEEMRTRLEMGM